MAEVTSYRAYDHKAWAKNGLRDFGDYAERVTYINQTEYGDGQLEGEWFYCDDKEQTIYHGTFGGWHSPGADHYTSADVYALVEDYQQEVARLESMEEYLDSGE